MRSLHKLIERWKIQAVVQAPPAAAAEVHRVFSDLGSRATPDVVALYEAIGGMDMMDNEYWRLWPLAEVRAENKDQSGFGLLFSDYLIASWCYRLKPDGEEHSAVYADHFDGRNPVLVAKSLEEFFDAYLVDAHRLFGGPTANR